ncbi:hypothetical protein BGZ76_010795 [Entomortierella beljakovae]|nr:hypothetical protein BGZ76_010795 [Entomortierella beljakovae]
MDFDTPAHEDAHRWNRLLPFNQATDGRLTIFLMILMIIPLGVCIGVQFVKPSPVQINPTSYKCGEGPVFYLRQRPKKRNQSSKGSSKSLGSILRWESPKSTPGTSNFEIGSDASSLRSHPQSLQFQSRSSVAYDSSIHEHQSIAQHSLAGVGDKNENLNTCDSRAVSKNERVRGMKGFWTKYGKDSDGEIIPLSKMNPRAFEYAIRDTEMLEELVKFSVTVFSVENTKFLQEYAGLKRQVQEYFKLTGRRSSRISRHIRNSSDAARSIANETEGSGPDVINRSRSKKLPNFASIASSIYSKRSTRGASNAGENSPMPTQDEYNTMRNSMLSEESAGNDGDPGPSTGAPYTAKSFGKHRMDLRGSQWRHSLHNSRSTPYTSPCGPVQEEGDAESQQMDPLPNMTPQRLNDGRSHQPKGSLGSRTFHSEITVSTIDDTNDSRPESGIASEGSSLSWYGRGNTGSSISYHDVTPSEIDSYYDVNSDSIHITTPYFFDDLGRATRHFRTDSHEYYDEGEAITSSQDGDDKSTDTVLSPSSALEEKTTALSSPKDITTSSSEPIHKIETRPKLTSGLSKSFTSGYPSTYEKYKEGVPTLSHKQSSRLVDPIRKSSPYHSPSSSISGTFSPRLPMQPQLHNSSPSRQAQAQAQPSLKGIATPRELLSQSGPNLAQTDQSSQLLEILHQVSPRRSTSISSWSKFRARPRSLPWSSTTSDVHRVSKAKFTSTNEEINANIIDGNMIVPKALLPAYWELYHTFIKPNSSLELNLSEHYVTEIKRLFLNSECFIEMYEPIFKEVQELVYSNVWPRFIQSIQRHPHGLPGKFKRSLNSFVRRFISDPGDDGPPGYFDRVVGWFHRGRVHDSGRIDRGTTDAFPHGQDNQDAISMELGLIQPQPPQVPYFHSQVSYLGLSSRDSALPGGPQIASGSANIEQVDLGQFGVMQDLDFSALQRIMVD